MKLRRGSVIALILSPLAVGLILAIFLQSPGVTNPVLRFQIRADLGTLILIAGGLLTASALGFWSFRRRANTRLRMAVENVREEAKGERRRFLRQLDHELKNPLTALQAELAYLAEGVPIEQTGKVLRDMNDQAERIGRLITDLRKLAQIEEQAFEREPVDIGELLQEVVEAVQDHPGLPERCLHLTLLQSPWKLPPVPGDRGLLWLACFNLVDNALKFTPPSSEIEVRAFEVSPWLVVEVTDNGPGIPPEDLPYIFEEFYRGKNVRGCPGSGLGLALVRAIMARHGGDIAVRSRSGQGTVFTLRLPLAS
ncbi:MAG: HAMP domain-containing sensor histidine kinase [Chloroflexota bacterium]